MIHGTFSVGAAGCYGIVSWLVSRCFTASIWTKVENPYSWDTISNMRVTQLQLFFGGFKSQHISTGVILLCLFRGSGVLFGISLSSWRFVVSAEFVLL